MKTEEILNKIKNNKTIVIVGAIILAIVIVIFYQFSAPKIKAESEQFNINIGHNNSKEIADQLKSEGFIRNKITFHIVLLGLKDLNLECAGCIMPGAFKISKSMNVWQIVKILKQAPYMRWVIIPEGLRKEQIADILAMTLGWDNQQRSDWVTDYTAMSYDYVEGVYFPDTYLIPVDETGLQVAQRFINKFNEKFAPYGDKFREENIKWDTALKIASIVQREAADKNDMPIIAGVIWNRLLKGMKLDIDATLQYARDSQLVYDDLCKDQGVNNERQCQCGEEDSKCYRRDGYYKGIESWWTPISVTDKKIDSAYNTYLNEGLPPHPICNPGLDAIDAVLNPIETECLYYLHDDGRQIHCANTYEEHMQNMDERNEKSH